jgi:hypothetical protein
MLALAKPADYDAIMNSKHKKTLAALFASPTPANIEWVAIERLMVAVGCEIVEGAGSRVTFVFQNHVESFHRPHPAKEAKRYQVRQARDFFDRIGVRP